MQLSVRFVIIFLECLVDSRGFSKVTSVFRFNKNPGYKGAGHLRTLGKIA